MSNRTAAIAFAAITGCASIVAITSPLGAAPATPESTAKAADECLAAPKATTPAGAHWYYRIEKGTKRKCWYLADEGGKTKKAASAPAASDTTEADTPPSIKITPPAKQDASKKAIQKSVANARAELRAEPDDDPSLAETTWPPMPNAPADSDIRKDNQAAAIQPAPEASSKQGWNVATRWPDPNAAASASDQPSAASSQPTQPAPALTAERLAATGTVAQAQSQAPAPVPAATTGAVPQQSQKPAATTETDEGLSIRVLLAILVGVLALAAILGPLLFKYFRPKPKEDDQSYVQRRPIWDLNESARTFPHDHPPLSDETHHIDEPRYGRALPQARVLDTDTRIQDTDVDELEELLARAAKRPAA